MTSYRFFRGGSTKNLPDWDRRRPRIPASSNLPLANPVVFFGRYLSQPFLRLFEPGIGVTAFTYWLLCAIWVLAVWALIGGAVTRIAALSMTRESRLGLVGGLRFSLTKMARRIFLPRSCRCRRLPLLGVLGIIYGLLMWSDVLALVMGLLWPVLLLAPCPSALPVLPAWDLAVRLAADVADDKHRRNRLVRRLESILFLHVPAAASLFVLPS